MTVANNMTYMPSISSGPTPIEQPGGQSGEGNARAIFELIRQHPDQGRDRDKMVWHDTLAWVAEQRCKRQAEQGWTGHIDPWGYGPNWYVRDAGIKLPDGYGTDDDANNIESVSHNGDGSVQGQGGTWDAWMRSPGHRIHLLGEEPTFAAQVLVGVGYYYLKTSAKRHYWCVLTIGVA